MVRQQLNIVITKEYSAPHREVYTAPLAPLKKPGMGSFHDGKEIAGQCRGMGSIAGGQSEEFLVKRRIEQGKDRTGTPPPYPIPHDRGFSVFTPIIVDTELKNPIVKAESLLGLRQRFSQPQPSCDCFFQY